MISRWRFLWLFAPHAGLFVYGYCFYYYLARSDMSGFMQTSFFFGALLSVALIGIDVLPRTSSAALTWRTGTVAILSRFATCGCFLRRSL